jgi:competence protein ComEC
VSPAERLLPSSVRRVEWLGAPHAVLGAFCVGIAAALVQPLPALPLAVVALGLAVGAVLLDGRRAFALAGSLAAVGWWWGSLRLEQLDASALAAQVAESGLARVEVTGPVRRSEFALRVPVKVVRFGSFDVREPAQLELPPDRAPPQGGILELVVRVERPKRAEREGGFDEAAYLRRRGVHVVLRATSFELVGRRGGLGGVADAVRRALAHSMAPGLDGERRAVVAGVVLGEDEGLAPELRERFRASGLYHLLSASQWT